MKLYKSKVYNCQKAYYIFFHIGYKIERKEKFQFKTWANDYTVLIKP